MSVTRSTRKIRSSGKSVRHQAIAAISAATGLVAWAAVSRADTFGNAWNTDGNITNLGSGTAWTDETVGGTNPAPPAGGDVAQFDSLTGLASPTTFTLGANTSWLGLSILNPGAAVTIGNAGDSGNTLTLGADGINMSAASQNLTIVDPLALEQNLSFSVNGGQSLTVNGPVNTGTSTLTFSGAGTQTVNGVISDGGAGGALAQSGSGTVILTAANSFTGNTTLSNGVMELNFNAAGAPASNILPTAAQLRLGGGTLLINGAASGGGTQSFSDTSSAIATPTLVTPGLSIIQLVNNGATAPTLNLGTMTVDNVSTNAGGLVEFIGPATSSDGLDATPVAATGTITVGSTPTIAGSGGILVDNGSIVPFAVVGQANGQVDDFAAVSGGVVVGGSTVAGFYTELTTSTGLTTMAGNADISGTGEMRISSSATYTTLRFNQPTGGQFAFEGNTANQFIVKTGKALSVGAIMVTPNVGPSNGGANNVIITDDTAGGPLTSQTLGGEENGQNVTIYQEDPQNALVINTGIRAAGGHNGGYSQAGPGTVQLNGNGATTITLPIDLYGGLTIAGSVEQGTVFGSASSIFLNGGTAAAIYTGTFDSGSARPIGLGAIGGGLAATPGNVLTVDGAITGAAGTGALNIGYGALQTNDSTAAGLITTVSTNGSGTVILSGAATNTYTGGTNVNFGTLRLDTASAGTGNITVNGSGTLAGNATLTNNVNVKSGGQFTPGDPIALGPLVGTIGVGNLNLNSGSISNFAFASGSSYSQVAVNGNFVLANGAQLDIDQSGSTNPFTLSGNYDLFIVTGTVSMGTAVFGSNAATYTIGTAPDGPDTLVTLNIAGATAETWTGTTSNSWAAAGNWNPFGIPNSVGAIAEFLGADPGTINLNGNETVGTVVFQSSSSYTIASGTPSNSTLHIQAAGSSSGTITDNLGTHFFTAPVSLDSSSTDITIANSTDTLNFDNTVEGIGGLTINPTGAGKVVLAANNTYQGATAIDGGTLQVGTGGANGSLGTSAAAIVNMGALVMDTTTNQTLSVGPTVPTGTGSLTQSGSGTLVLTGANNAGAVNINAGTIQLATAASLTATGNLTMSGGTTFDMNGNSPMVGGLSGAGTIDNVSAAGTPSLTIGSDGANDTFSGVIQNTTGTVSLVKTGGGTQTLSGVNLYTGGTTISAGAVLATQSNGLGSGAITVTAANGLQLGNGVTLSNAITDSVTTAEFEDVAAGGSATLSGNIAASGSNQFRVGTSNTTSTLTLTGASTGGTSGIFIITRGNIIIAGTGSVTSSHTSNALLIGRQSNTSTLNLTLENSAQLNSAFGIDMGSGTAGSDDATINLTLLGSSSISAGGPFNLNDDSNTSAGPLSISLGGTSNLTTTAFQDSSTISGTSTAVSISGGTITAAASDTLTNATPTGNIFLPEFSNGNNIVAGISINVGTGGATINNGGFNITLGESIGDGGGSLADTMNFTGTGTTVLANANSYQGATTITAGTVVIANSSGSATGSNQINVNGGTLASASAARVALLNNGSNAATLDNAGLGSIAGPVFVGAAGTVAPGEVGSIGTMSLSGLTTVSGSTLNFDLGTGSGVITNGDLLTLAGTVSIGPGTALTFGTNPGVADIGNDYQLIGGSIGTIYLPNFVLPTPASGTSYSVSKIGGFVDLVVSAGAADLTWNNTGAGAPTDGVTWDTTHINWNNGSGPATYADGDGVTFNDTNNSHYAVTLNSTVMPGSVTINTTATSAPTYTISGTGSIAGTTSLTKTGTGIATISTPNTYSGGTFVNGGTLVIGQTTVANTVALPDGAVTIGAAGKLALATNAVASSPFVSSQADISNQLMKLTSLSITPGGVLDVGNNHFNVLDLGGVPNDALFTTLLGYVKSGAITSSDVNGSYGVGVVDGNANIAGSPVSAGQIEVAYTLEGDANLDGKVDATDFGIFAPNFGATGFTLGWEGGDFNYDGKVDATDFGLFAPNFGQSDSGTAVSLPSADYAALDAFAAANGLSLTSVPEPASASIMIILGSAILRRRRRSSL